MSWIAVGSAAVGFAASTISSNNNKAAIQGASDAQTQSNREAIAAQREQFDKIMQNLSPFISGGKSALGGLFDLLGLSGADKQSSAISGIENSPEFQALSKQGEEAILQNASATGAVRGGNVQEALAQYRPNLLSSLINDRYNKLSSIAQMGESAAAGAGSFGQNYASNVGNLAIQQGNNSANAVLAQQMNNNNLLSQFGNIAGQSGLYDKFFPKQNVGKL